MIILFLTFLQFMLLTNESIAQLIAFNLPDQALLRRHENAIERRLVRLQPHKTP